MTQTAAVADPRAAQVLTQAVVGATDRLGLTQKTTAATLGVSEATVSRLSRGRSIDPATKEGELAILLVRLYRSLDAMVGGNAEQARAWLHAPNHHLQGTPAEMIKGVAGIVRVVEYLDALRGKS
jgi:transcriptional regulator with XRE-family HTH domain